MYLQMFSRKNLSGKTIPKFPHCALSSSNLTCHSPFLMVIAPPAPHAPFTPAPQYSSNYSGETAPRLPSFNYVEPPNEAKHWLVQRHPRPLDAAIIDKIDDVFRNRWRALLSVDDMVDSVMTFLNNSGMLDNTIAMYTSDHGYHLGTFGLPLDKRQPYETDIRVPLLVRGPGVVQDERQPALAVITTDIAPTILDIAGLNSEDFGMDGISLYPLLKNESHHSRTVLPTISI